MVPKDKKYQIKILSSLEKVFPKQEPKEKPEVQKLSGLRGEIVSFQAAFYGAGIGKESATLQIDSEIEEWIRVRTVELVPSSFPCNATYDENYLSTEPGMFPDLLREVKKNQVFLIAHQWRCLWIDVEIPVDARPGIYTIKVCLKGEKGNILCENSARMQVIDALLPKQKLYHTEWFHGDCLADYYCVEPWSERFWEIFENFIKVYGKRGINTILTPVLTPPLDTAVGGERTTIQLAIIKKTEKHYRFDFSRLERWIQICKKYGVQYFEISHLFTQWGAEYAPKVIVEDNGKLKKMFGWETKADSPEYQVFLKEYLQALTKQLCDWGMQNQVYFHTSDEPSKEHLESYTKARNLIRPYLAGFKTIDALSEYKFYKEGLVEKPVPGTSHVETFLKEKVPGLWVYYCTSQCTEVSNRFMAMPSARNRILGVQLYKYKIEGFLHWGFNFYNTQFSLEHINPYAVTDAGAAFPSGDAFLVYPGKDGIPEESLRLMVLMQAMQDIRALELLETLIGREAVIEEIDRGLGEGITFSKYPISDIWILGFRNRINERIEREIEKK